MRQLSALTRRQELERQAMLAMRPESDGALTAWVRAATDLAARQRRELRSLASGEAQCD